MPETDKPLGCLWEECPKSSSNAMSVRKQDESIDVGQCSDVQLRNIWRSPTLAFNVPEIARSPVSPAARFPTVFDLGQRLLSQGNDYPCFKKISS